jgi:TM2 domain-containing membrane protein YozV
VLEERNAHDSIEAESVPPEVHPDQDYYGRSNTHVQRPPGSSSTWSASATHEPHSPSRVLPGRGPVLTVPPGLGALPASMRASAPAGQLRLPRKSRVLAIMLALVPGAVGLFGLGHFYTGRRVHGVLLLVGFWVVTALLTVYAQAGVYAFGWLGLMIYTPISAYRAAVRRNAAGALPITM